MEISCLDPDSKRSHRRGEGIPKDCLQHRDQVLDAGCGPNFKASNPNTLIVITEMAVSGPDDVALELAKNSG